MARVTRLGAIIRCIRGLDFNFYFLEHLAIGVEVAERHPHAIPRFGCLAVRKVLHRYGVAPFAVDKYVGEDVRGGEQVARHCQPSLFDDTTFGVGHIAQVAVGVGVDDVKIYKVFGFHSLPVLAFVLFEAGFAVRQPEFTQLNVGGADGSRHLLYAGPVPYHRLFKRFEAVVQQQ